MSDHMHQPAGPSDDRASGLNRGELQDRAIRGATWTVVHTMVSLPLAFAVNIVIARALGVVDYGRLAFLTAVMGIVGAVIALGTGTGLVQFGSKAHASGRTEEVKHLLSATQGFRLLVTAPIMTLLVISIADVDPVLVAIAVVFGVLGPATFSTAANCIHIENKTAAGAKINMVVNIVLQAVVVAVVLLVGTADAVWAARLAVGGFLVGFISLFLIAPAYRRAVLRPTLPRNFPPGFWRFAIPIGFAGVIGSLVVSRTEVIVLTWMSAPVAAGIFAMAFGLAGHIFSPAQALIGPLVPAVSGLREVDEGAVARAFSRTFRGASTIVALLVSAALPAFAALVPTIYGAEYQDVPAVMIVLGIAGGLLVVAGPVQAFVQARLSGRRVLAVNLLALLVDVALAVSLIPILGVWGAVIANVAAAATQMGILLFGEIRALGLKWGGAARDGLPAVVGSTACLASWAAISILPIGPLASALVGGVSGLGITLTGLWVTRSGLAAGDAEAILHTMPVRLSRAMRPVLGLCTHRKLL